jgi:protein-tyrosine-phosphatase
MQESSWNQPEDEILGFLNQTPTDMLTHLRNRGGALDFADTKTLLAERDGEWDTSEVPQLYFNRVEKAIQGLSRAGINSDLNKRRDMALYYLKALGEFDAAVRDWENRPAGQKTWQSIKTFISAEHAKENKQNKLTAKNFKANMIEEQAEATEELIAALTEKHTQQIENLIKSNTEAMKQMISLIKNNKKEPGDKQQPDEEKKKKREERRQRFKDAPICKHCGKKHPTKKEDECWELETNNASRPANWKSSKST